MYTRVTMIMTELIASAAMEELIQMAQLGHPLWINSSDGSSALLNEDEYIRIFPREIVPGQSGYRCEASRERAVVNMNRSKLVEILMDVNQYSTVFSGIVSRATTQDVLSIGVAGNYNGALQVMNSETQVPSPLVPARTSTFARYCKKIVDGTWAVVDVSSDNLLGYSSVLNSCQRRPSGCLIQEMENGYSKVTWVEHVLVNDRGVHSLYKQLVKSGHAFEAKRWVATLDRQCQRHTSALAIITPNWITTQEWRTNILKMAERMVSSFCVGLSASTTHTWTSMITDEDDGVLMMTRKSVDDPGRPSGVVLVAATSFQLPVPPKRVFEFLCDKNCRNKWDILSNDDIVQEVAHITNGPDLRNSVSLLRVNSVDSSQSNMLILQESCIDSVASYLVYAPMDIVAMSALMNGDNPDYIALLPSGFAILPDGTNESIYGSILTVAFQILVDLGPTAKLCLRYVAAVNRLIVCTMERIKASLSLDNEPQMISSFFSS